MESIFERLLISSVQAILEVGAILVRLRMVTYFENTKSVAGRYFLDRICERYLPGRMISLCDR